VPTLIINILCTNKIRFIINAASWISFNLIEKDGKVKLLIALFERYLVPTVLLR
jgi:hypothetical protein